MPCHDWKAYESESGLLEESLAGKPPYRRLFMDSMVTEESSGLVRKFHAARKLKKPIIPKDRPWEGWGPYQYGTVLWDQGKLRMWYEAVGIRAEGVPKHCNCYAESTDGIHWVKPDLDVYQFPGFAKTNIISQGQSHNASVIKVRNPESPDMAWALYSHGGEHGPHVAYSSDGLHWRWHEKPEYTNLFGTSDVVNFFWDCYNDRYVCTWKGGGRKRRAVGVAMSDDGIHWTKPCEGPVFESDDLDPDPTQIYGMPAFPYQGMYIGLPWMYHARNFKYGPYTAKRMYEAQEDSPCTMDVQLSWTWDLVNWNRTPKREPFIALGKKPDWDWGMIYTARAPVVVNNELWFYYGGFNQVHDRTPIEGAIGLAKLRIDGFCSMRAGGREGWMVSRREMFRTPKVTINARTHGDGYVTAELLDRENKPIKGFTRADCVPFTGDSICHTLEWRTNKFAESMLQPPKKVKFYIKSADLYSYLPVDIDESMEVDDQGYEIGNPWRVWHVD
jgi:hypothetical protein